MSPSLFPFPLPSFPLFEKVDGGTVTHGALAHLTQEGFFTQAFPDGKDRPIPVVKQLLLEMAAKDPTIDGEFIQTNDSIPPAHITHPSQRDPLTFGCFWAISTTMAISRRRSSK